MKTGTILGIFLVLLCATAGAESHRPRHYFPDSEAAVTIDGDRRFNRALYGAHTGFRVDCSDLPEFGIYLPRMGGNLLITLPQGSCTARYTPGRMDYSQGGVEIETQVGRHTDMALWGIKNLNDTAVTVRIRFGGVADKRFYRDGDLGVDPPDCFDLKQEYCDGNTFKENGDTVTVGYGSKERKTLTLLIPASSYHITDLPSYEGVLALAPRERVVMALFPSGEIPAASADSLLMQAETDRKELAGGVTFCTPAPWLNPIGGALSVAADGIWSGETWLHGAVGWRTPHLGWRGAYTGDAIGRHDRARKHLSTYAANQITDIPPIFNHPRQDSTLNLARSEKRWGTPFYSNGYICRRPGKKDEMSHYDMNLVYIDALLRHFRHTGDTTLMKTLFPVIKRHLEWEKRNFDPDGDFLYDAYCCIWASDALYYSGGAVTHSTAYNLFANRLTALVAETIGEDPAPFRAEAEGIAAALERELWMADKGYWAEYKDAAGYRRTHRASALWTIYHAIDSEVADPFKAYSATCYIDSAIPHIPVRGEGVKEDLYTLSTSSWKPYSWSINNVAIAETMHTALAYWLAGRNEEAYRLMEAVAMDNMYLGASPMNFGQVSHYDAARGECYRDFADAIGVWSRALTEGLFGIRPDLLSPGKHIVRIVPGFPDEWYSASVSLPELSYSFKREGNRTTYSVTNRYGRDSSIELTVPARGVESVMVNGRPVNWTTALSIGRPRITVNAGMEQEITLEITERADSPASATGKVRTEGAVTFREITDGTVKWWSAETVTGSYQEKIPDTNRFNEVHASRCHTVDLRHHYNASVTDIFHNRYISPRPRVTTLQIPVHGMGEWCHPTLTSEIDDSGLRTRLAACSDILVTETGIPFSLPADGENILFTSLWDNYPDSSSVDLSGYGEHLYLLMAGSTNHMQYGIDNGRIIVTYTDGPQIVVPLISPHNWAPVELDFYHDDHAFSLAPGTLPPYRLHLATGHMSRNLGEDLGIRGVADRFIPSGAGIVLDIPIDSKRELKSLTLETLSGDVVIGLMGLTIQRPDI